MALGSGWWVGWSIKWRATLQKHDQLTLACGTALGLLLVLASWCWQGGHQGRLLDIDQAQPTAAKFLIDVNDADWPEFALLPGIGEKRARKIVELRGQLGRFRSHDELRQVKGIGPKTMEALRPNLLPLEQSPNMEPEPE